MVRREVYMVESADAAVTLREQRVAAAPKVGAIPAYLEQVFLAIARYSRGDELTVVRADVRKAVELLENDGAGLQMPFDFRDHDQYYGALWGLSLSMLFGDPSLQFVQRGAGKDAVFDRLLKLTGALVAPVGTMVRPDLYGNLIAAMDRPKESGDAIAAFLKSWYAGMGQTHWHDTHLRHDPLFFGYWAFELAAVVKALSISDNGFADNIFYPRDLVHQRIFRTWLDGSMGDRERQLFEFGTANAALAAARQALLSFFEGTATEASFQGAGDSFKMLSGLLGLTPGALKENPEALRLGLLQVIRAILSVSKAALAGADGDGGEAGLIGDRKKLLETFREIQAKMDQEGDLEAASKILGQYVDLEGEGGVSSGAGSLGAGSSGADSSRAVALARQRLEAVNQAFAGLVEDQSIGLEGLFSGIDRLMQEHAAQLGIEPRKPYDAYESAGKDVSKALDEANKKNMIQEDFDWSSLWKKKSE